MGSIPTRSRHRVALALLLVPLVLAMAPAASAAQEAGETRSGVSAEPPISPRRAFLYSFLLPGAGQAALDRQGSGALFFLVEAAALTLVHRSAEDLRIARTYAGDSMPLRYRIDATTGLAERDANGDPVVEAWSSSRYSDAYVRTRRQHYEDWLAVAVFNHLFSGADAFVAAQLWDLKGRVSLRTTPYGATLTATIPFR